MREIDNVMDDAYQTVCDMASIDPSEPLLPLNTYAEKMGLSNASKGQRLLGGIAVLLDLSIESNPYEKIDRLSLDEGIAKIDSMLSEQVNQILHHPAFQQLEATWLGLNYLVGKTDLSSNIHIELLDVDKQTCLEDFNDADSLVQSGLYRHVYVDEFDTAGGEPFSAIISDYTFDASQHDINLLTHFSKVAASAHAPFIGAVDSVFFNKDSMLDVMSIENIHTYMERAEYTTWNAFRESNDARYVGLALTKFLLREPHNTERSVKSFVFEESINVEENKDFLWGNASFAFAGNIVQSFHLHGWTVNIRGPESGGKVEGLPLYKRANQGLMQIKIPVECVISETKELALAKEGFMPLIYYKNSNFGCFFSANSTQKPACYHEDEAMANTRMNARLPYVFLTSRIAHYLKVLQRETIGSNKNRVELENELNAWLQTLVTKMNHPSPDIAATHPLRDGYVEVISNPKNPGFYRVNLFVMPHFQIEGVDVKLSLVSQMPGQLQQKT